MESTIPQETLDRLLNLSAVNGRFLVTYVWVDQNSSLRSKGRILEEEPKALNDVPRWSVDGSTTGQAPPNNMEVVLVPVILFKDPLDHAERNFVAFCECLNHKNQPIASNHRRSCDVTSSAVEGEHVFIGFTQQYTLLDSKGLPLGWPQDCVPNVPDTTYSVLSPVPGNKVADVHHRVCLHLGIQISAFNAGPRPGQFAFEIGPVESGVLASDHLWLARYFLQRVAELFDLTVSFQPILFQGDTQRLRCLTTFSTEGMRARGGYPRLIEEAVDALYPVHSQTLDIYYGNGEKPTEGFSGGVADNEVSIRFPRKVAQQGFGYFEDRRVPSNADPYLVTDHLMRTIILNKIQKNQVQVGAEHQDAKMMQGLQTTIGTTTGEFLGHVSNSNAGANVSGGQLPDGNAQHEAAKKAELEWANKPISSIPSFQPSTGSGVTGGSANQAVEEDGWNE